MSSLPLNGVRVVEYAQYVAGPLCGVLLARFGLEWDDVHAALPGDQAVLTSKQDTTAAIERTIAASSTEEWLDRLGEAGVPCGVVQMRETVHADPQVVAAGLVGDVEQPGLGEVRLLAPFVRVGGAVPEPMPAPVLGADTEVVLGELP